jgi:hypothetical protein
LLHPQVLKVRRKVLGAEGSAARIRRSGSSGLGWFSSYQASGNWLSAIEGRLEEFPFTLDTCERVRSSVPELDSGPSRQLLDDASDQDLSRLCHGAHHGGDVDGDPARSVLEHLPFPGMDPRPDLESERAF